MLIFICILVFAFCSKFTDPNTFSNYQQIEMKHVHLEWLLDLKQKKIDAIAHYTFQCKTQNLDLIQLDIYKMKIHKILDQQGQELQFIINVDEEQTNIQGDQLLIQLPKLLDNKEIYKLQIFYQIDEKARALSFLNPEQTDSKLTDYLYSQCQSINCRSMLPLQDTPSIKLTYSATILTLDPLLNVFMSANTVEPHELLSNYDQSISKIYYFELNIPIPPYLIAIIAGPLEEQQISQKSSVISEKPKLQQYVQELEDVDEYLTKLEMYIGPYKWGKLRLVIMPFSFPFGGMEHPILAFINPTVLVGDKSYMGTVIHEIAHSWVGNTVTASDWENFWINEGFCMFLERKILEEVYEKDYALIDADIDNLEMVEDVKTYIKSENPSLASLHPNLKGTNPDDGYNRIPYEKGYQLLVYLESIIGESDFQLLLRDWIIKNEYKSVRENQFYKFLIFWLKNRKDQQGYQTVKSKIKKIYKVWVYKPGVSPIKLDFSNRLSKQVRELTIKWLENDQEYIKSSADTFNSFYSIQKMFFFQLLLQKYHKLSIKQIAQIEELYEMKSIKNYYIQFRWYLLTIQTRYTNQNTNLDEIIEFFKEIGQQRLILVMYSKLNLEKSKQIYQENKAFYHPIAQYEIEHMFKRRVHQLGQLIHRLKQ